MARMGAGDGAHRVRAFGRIGPAATGYVHIDEARQYGWRVRRYGAGLDGIDALAKLNAALDPAQVGENAAQERAHVASCSGGASPRASSIAPSNAVPLGACTHWASSSGR